jgi:Kef-type K+ transport system membrane component KefB
MAHSPLLLQLIVILGCARVLGLILRFFGQPMVIGEMVAGLMLGPAVFGAVAPTLQAALLQRSSMPELDAISQLGLVLFMFIVGAEPRLPSGARAQIMAASWIGVLSVLLPMALGFAVAVPLHPLLAPPGVGFWPFSLFIAAAMSITAFPVMARILKDRGETNTRIGRLSLSGAAVADVERGCVFRCRSGSYAVDPASRRRRQDHWGQRRRAERARFDGTDRHEGRARCGTDRQAAVHYAPGHGTRDDGDDWALAESIRARSG